MTKAKYSYKSSRRPFRYSIDRHTDLERLFNIDSTNGTITTLKALDREMSKWHNISVVATEISNGSFTNGACHARFSDPPSTAFFTRPLQITQARRLECPCSSKCWTSTTTRRSSRCPTTRSSARTSKLDRYVKSPTRVSGRHQNPCVRCSQYALDLNDLQARPSTRVYAGYALSYHLFL